MWNIKVFIKFRHPKINTGSVCLIIAERKTSYDNRNFEFCHPPEEKKI